MRVQYNEVRLYLRSERGHLELFLYFWVMAGPPNVMSGPGKTFPLPPLGGPDKMLLIHDESEPAVSVVYINMLCIFAVTGTRRERIAGSSRSCDFRHCTLCCICKWTVHCSCVINKMQMHMFFRRVDRCVVNKSLHWILSKLCTKIGWLGYLRHILRHQLLLQQKGGQQTESKKPTRAGKLLHVKCC